MKSPFIFLASFFTVANSYKPNDSRIRSNPPRSSNRVRQPPTLITQSQQGTRSSPSSRIRRVGPSSPIPTTQEIHRSIPGAFRSTSPLFYEPDFAQRIVFPEAEGTEISCAIAEPFPVSSMLSTFIFGSEQLDDIVAEIIDESIYTINYEVQRPIHAVSVKFYS